MQPPAGTLGPRRRWPIVVLAMLLVLAAGFYLGGGWTSPVGCTSRG
jgi:hypothetical protein